MKNVYFISKSFLLMSLSMLFAQLVIFTVADLVTDQEVNFYFNEVFILSLVFGLINCWVPIFVKLFMLEES